MKIYADWEIQLVIDRLHAQAMMRADAINEERRARGGQADSNAYENTTAWHTINIIKQLQRTITEIKQDVEVLELAKTTLNEVVNIVDTSPVPSDMCDLPTVGSKIPQKDMSKRRK